MSLPQLHDGEYAIVRYTHGGAEELAQYHRPDDAGTGFWSYFGTDWIDSESQVVVVRPVQIITAEPA
jgi:hypothetical protein